jgi:hypothetical protein
MNREDIIRIAQDAGLHIATDVKWMPIIGLKYAEKFAALVIANHPPQSYMTWQEGYEAGKHDEREACAKACDDRVIAYKYATDVWAQEHIDEARHLAKAIRARGQA